MSKKDNVLNHARQPHHRYLHQKSTIPELRHNRQAAPNKHHYRTHSKERNDRQHIASPHSAPVAPHP